MDQEQEEMEESINLLVTTEIQQELILVAVVVAVVELDGRYFYTVQMEEMVVAE